MEAIWLLKYFEWSLSSIVNRPLCCSFPLAFHSRLERASHKRKKFHLILLLFTPSKYISKHSDGTRIILNIYITQSKSNRTFFGTFLSAFSLDRLQVYKRTFWLNCDLFTLFCAPNCVWIIADRAHIAPSTLLSVEGYLADWLINDRFVMSCFGSTTKCFATSCCHCDERQWANR